MMRVLGLVTLALAGTVLATPDASACHRASAVVCYTPCYWEPCWPHHHYCYCLAYRDPYLERGAMLVRCDYCPCHPYHHHWHFCYVFLTGRYEWVKIYRCFPYGTPLDKEAEAAEGFKKAAAELPGKATIVVNLPAGTKLTIDGAPLETSTATTRRFETATLQAGESASYVFAAESVSGERRVGKRTVTVRPYETVTIDLGQETEAVVSAK